MKYSDYRKYLPSKRFQISLAIAILLVLIAIAITYRKNDVTGQLSVETATSSDNSGAQIDPQVAAEEAQQEQEYESLNPTDKMARDFLSNIIVNQPVDQQMDQATLDNVVNNTLQDIPNKNFLGTTTVYDLNVLPVNDSTIKSDVINYVNIYYSITQDLLKNKDKNLNIIKNQLSEDADSDKKLLDPINSAYQKEILGLKTVPIHADIESEAVSLHLSIINNLEGLVAINNDIINAKSAGDAVTVYADLLAFTNIDKTLAVTIDTIDGIFKIPRNN